MRCVLALDQGTTSSRSILFGKDGRAVASAQQEFPQILPAPGHVEEGRDRGQLVVGEGQHVDGVRQVRPRGGVPRPPPGPPHGTVSAGWPV